VTLRPHDPDGRQLAALDPTADRLLGDAQPAKSNSERHGRLLVLLDTGLVSYLVDHLVTPRGCPGHDRVHPIGVPGQVIGQ